MNMALSSRSVMKIEIKITNDLKHFYYMTVGPMVTKDH